MAKTPRKSQPIPANPASDSAANSATAGGIQFLLTVNGNDFRRDSVLSWSGSLLVTSFVSSHELVAAITADLQGPGAGDDA